MRNRTLLLIMCIGALSACGEDEDPKCATGVSCDSTASPVEAGTAALPDATTSVSSGSDAGAIASTDAGSNPGNNPGSNPGRLDAGPTVASDAGKPVVDAGPAAPVGDGGMGPTMAGGPAKPSAGCGMPAPMGGNGTIDVGGTMREYIVALPQNYDPMKPYKLIFAWHGLGGTAASIARSWYGLQSRAQNSAIFVTGQGLPTSGTASGAGAGGAGWANTGGQDVAFVKALYARIQSTMCIDETRVFSTGMSYGGIMSNTLGCSMGDVFRAIAPIAGMGPGFGGRATCVGEVAVWMAHGDNDTVVSTASGMASRDFWVKANKCQQTSKPVEPSPCVTYDACASDLPVTFCLFAGTHTVPPFASAAIWSFFSQF